MIEEDHLEEDKSNMMSERLNKSLELHLNQSCKNNILPHSLLNLKSRDSKQQLKHERSSPNKRDIVYDFEAPGEKKKSWASGDK